MRNNSSAASADAAVSFFRHALVSVYTIKNKIVKKISCIFIYIFIKFNRTQKMVHAQRDCTLCGGMHSLD